MSEKPHKAPGKHYREGLSLVEVMDMFPDEAAAIFWFESIVWPTGRCCGKCGSLKTREANHKTMPYRCSDCRSCFSVRTGTPPREVQRPAPQVGDRHLPLPDQLEVGLVHEAASGPQGHAIDRVVHAPHGASRLVDEPPQVGCPQRDE